MTDPSTATILGGILIAIASGIMGKYIGGAHKVDEKVCAERQHHCSALVCTELTHIKASLEEIKSELKKKT